MLVAQKPLALWVVAAVIFVICLLYAAALWRHKAFCRLGSIATLTLSPAVRWTMAISLCLSWIAAGIALMGPQGNPHPLPTGEEEVLNQQIVSEEETEEMGMRRKKAHDVIFLLDASQSMAVADTRPGASRLEYAKEIVDEVMAKLDGQSAALYAFTSELTPLSPPTLDYLYTRLVLRKVGLNEGDAAGTDLMEALEGVSRRHGAGDKAKTLVVFTDGGDTRLEKTATNERDQELAAILSRVDGMRTITVGLGSHEGEVIPDVTFEGEQVRSTLDEELLKRLADKGGGVYFFANDYSPLVLAGQIVDQIHQEEQIDEEEQMMSTVELERLSRQDATIVYDRYFQIPLLFAVLFLALAYTLRVRGVAC